MIFFDGNDEKLVRCTSCEKQCIFVQNSTGQVKNEYKNIKNINIITKLEHTCDSGVTRKGGPGFIPAIYSPLKTIITFFNRNRVGITHTCEIYDMKVEKLSDAELTALIV